jgi:hypothetical protein
VVLAVVAIAMSVSARISVRTARRIALGCGSWQLAAIALMGWCLVLVGQEGGRWQQEE